MNVENTRVRGWMGQAFTCVDGELSPAKWKRIKRSLLGPTKLHRLLRFFRKDKHIHYLVSIGNYGEAMAVDVQFDTYNDVGRLTVQLPQYIGPRHIPPRTEILLLKRVWEKIGFGIIPRSKWPMEMLDYGGCKSPILEYDGEKFTEIRIE